PHEFQAAHLVEFADTDMAGIMHFANYFRYMEETEHAFLRSLGLSVHMREGERILGLPRVSATCEFRAPLRYQDRVQVRLRVREKKEKSLTYAFVFRKVEETGTVEVARGSLTVVCVAIDEQAGTMKAVRLPEAFDRQIEVAPEEGN